MGSIKDRSSADLYFRNLDGEMTLQYWPDLRGSTITNQVELISSSTLQDVIIQEYSFELSCEGNLFLHGKSSFGYFTPLMLKNQSGLNGKDSQVTWSSNHPDSGQWIELDTGQSPGVAFQHPQIPHISRAWISKSGGRNNSGYVQTQIQIPNDAWFYRAHFFQDPVMPGSLGVESMARALTGSSASLGTNPNLRWRIQPGIKTSWKYRGQITPDVESIDIELHIKKLNQGNNRDQITADGNLWLGSTRIYEVKDISLESY
jgi:3-hydroxymyristoyl/3-hydroxydecanoyl-(acyl carrier protein) dehydratase